MRQAFRVAGIPIRVDASWLLIFGLISWSLASGYFPRVLPEASVGAAWINGIVAAALLFGSVLLHELSHALVAIEHGVPVAGIRLHVFGGVSELEAEPATPRDEALIAAVGPLTSFVIAAVCYALGRAVTDWPWLEALTGYLAAVNLTVGVFNLVPGFPLDGGRLLRAMLWWWSDDVDRATRWAGHAGSVFALLLVALGIARALGGEAIGGLWFVLIGLFLHQAARSSQELVRIRRRLEPLRVADVMTRTPDAGVGAGDETAVDSQASAWQAFLRLGHARNGRVAVVDNGRLVGNLSVQDIQHALAARRAGHDTTDRAA